MNNHKLNCQMSAKGWAASVPPECTCNSQPPLSQCCGAIPHRLDIEVVCSNCGKPFTPTNECCNECSRNDNFCIPSCYPKHCHFKGCPCHKEEKCDHNQNKKLGCGGCSGNPQQEKKIVSLCSGCYCMTTTFEECCGKCGADKSHKIAPESSEWMNAFNNTWNQEFGIHREIARDRFFNFIDQFIKGARKKAKDELNESMNEYIKGIETDVREQERHKIASDLKNICNHTKTEHGLSRALANYINKLETNE